MVGGMGKPTTTTTTRNTQSNKGKLLKFLRKRIPFLEWIKTYKKGDLVADGIAGITVGMTVVPQSMAYAAIAGLSPEYGLYSSYFGVFLYVFLGSCKQTAIGPTAVMSLLTYETCGADNPSCAILSGFYAGVFELLMFLLQLGWVVNFIPESVVIGFTAGAATTIMSSQMKNLLGIKGPKGSGFVGYWTSLVRDIGTISLGDSILGVGAILVLLFLREIKDLRFVKSRGPLLKRLCWLLSVGRNAIVVVITSLISYLWTPEPPYQLTGHVHGGFPPLRVPDFQLPVRGNQTLVEDGNTNYHTFQDSIAILGSGPLIIALISVLQNVSISKAFGADQSIDAGQEMLALGLASVGGSFLFSIPVSGSFSRSAVNQASGVRSPMSGVFTSILVLLSLGLLTPSFYFIPKPSLAAVIISAVVFMIEFQALPVMWRVKKTDFCVCLLTFLTSIMFGMEIGILVGVAVSILQLLLSTLKPSLNPEVVTDPSTGIEYLLFTPGGDRLTFQAVDYVRQQILKASRNHGDTVGIYILNFRNWKSGHDYTSATALVGLLSSLEKEGRSLIFMGCNDEWVRALAAVQGEEDGKPLPIIQGHEDIPTALKRMVTKKKNSVIMINMRKDSVNNNPVSKPLLT